MQPFFNIFTVSNLLEFSKNTENSVGLLRGLAQSCNRKRKSDFLIRYKTFPHGPYEYTTAIPQIKRTLFGQEKENHTRWIPYEAWRQITPEEDTNFLDSDLFNHVDLDEDNPWAEHFNTALHYEERSQSEEKKHEPSDDGKSFDIFQSRIEELAPLGENIESCKTFILRATENSVRVLCDGPTGVPNNDLYAVVIDHKNIQLLQRLDHPKFDTVDEIDTLKDEEVAKAYKSGFHIELTTETRRKLLDMDIVQDLAKLSLLDPRQELSNYMDHLTLRGVAAISELYNGFSGASIDVRAVKLDLKESRWLLSAKTHEDDKLVFSPTFIYQPLILSHAQCFSCIAMLETGSFDLEPAQLGNVMALSAVDSLYVASSLLHDPADYAQQFCIKRLTGNIGRAGLAFLVPPVAPMIKRYDPVDQWQLLDHADFDGKLENNFSSTSLQLSFTEAIFPINVGFSGGMDTEAFFLETLVSVYDAGDWVADLDVLKAFKSASFHRCLPCVDPKVLDPFRKFTSADRFAEILCPNDNVCIVRAWKNWQARLATTSICIARGYNVVVITNENICWKCIEILVDKALSKMPSQPVIVIS